MTVVVCVRSNFGYQGMIQLPNGSTVKDLKREVEKQTGMSAARMRVFHRGLTMGSDDSATLERVGGQTHITLTVDGDCAEAAEPAEAIRRPQLGLEAREPDIYRPGPGERSVRVSLRTLCNKLITVDVPLDMAIGEIKRRILEPATLVYTGRVTPAVQMVVIFKGHELADDMTPRGLDLMNASVLHLGREMDRDALDDIVHSDRLRANCLHCRSPGVQLDVRHSCPKCGVEAVRVERGEVEVGRSTWKDMLRVEVKCFNPPCMYHGKGATNMVCKRKVPPHNLCPSRMHSGMAEDLTFKPAEVPEEGMTLEETQLRQLVAFLNNLFCYPHEGGLECVRPAAAAAAGAAGGGAA